MEKIKIKNGKKYIVAQEELLVEITNEEIQKEIDDLNSMLEDLKLRNAEEEKEIKKRIKELEKEL